MVRRSVISGSYFPSSPAVLASAIRNMCPVRQEGATALEDVYGVVVPHASLDYCGEVAASLWRQVDVPGRVIILGPNHTGLGSVAAVASCSSFSTPAGEIRVDRAMCLALVSGGGTMTLDDVAHEEEHSIEAVLPFIQIINPDAIVTPVCLRMLSYRECVEMAATIAGVIRDADPAAGAILLVASSDLNHGDPVRIGNRRDRMVLDRIEAMDPQGLYDAVVEHHLSMCGLAPVVVMMLAAMALGAGFAETIAYSTSMERTGDPSSVVGYASVVIRRRCPVDRIRNLRSRAGSAGGADGQG